MAGKKVKGQAFGLNLGSVLDPQDDDDPSIEFEFDADPAQQFVAPLYRTLADRIRAVRKPLDAELAVGDFLGMVEEMVNAGVPAGEGETAQGFLLMQIVHHASEQATPEALAVLRVLAVLAREPLRSFTAALAEGLAAAGVKDRAWVKLLGSSVVGRCWRYGDVLGQQDSVNLTFAYGKEEHLVSVLIDHGLGGGIKDSWIGDDPERAWQDLSSIAARTPGMELAVISWAQARDMVLAAISRPVCAVEEDQKHDVPASAGIIRARMAQLGAPSTVVPNAKRANAMQAALKQVGAKQAGAGVREPVAAASVLSLKVTLRHSKPPIWRRLEVPAEITLEVLHDVLQVAFGWNGSHLHVFDDGRQSYGLPDPELDCLDEHGVQLSKLIGAGGSLLYTYDFGDDWEHLIVLEKRQPAEPGVAYPRCTGGRRAAPPDDCGGPGGYDHLLAAVADQEDPEHHEMVQWLAGITGRSRAEVRAFDPAAFDRRELNKVLSHPASFPAGWS